MQVQYIQLSLDSSHAQNEKLQWLSGYSCEAFAELFTSQNRFSTIWQEKMVQVKKPGNRVSFGSVKRKNKNKTKQNKTNNKKKHCLHLPKLSWRNFQREKNKEKEYASLKKYQRHYMSINSLKKIEY